MYFLTVYFLLLYEQKPNDLTQIKSYDQDQNNFVQIYSITPNSGPITGRISVSIDGSGFLPFNQNNVDLLDTAFNPGSGVDIWINSIILQANNKILISGNFTKYNNVSRNHIARLNPDGSLDSTFNPDRGANFLIWITTLQPDSKILIGGNFTQYNGTPRNRLARLNSDGSLDTTFNPGTRTNSLLWAITLQPDGKILIGGGFYQYNDTPRDRIARLNPDGSLCPTFKPKKI